MVNDTLSVQQLHDLDPEDLLEEALQDDDVLRLLEDLLRIKRQRVSDWLGTVDGEDVATLDPDASVDAVVEALARDGFTANWLLSYHYHGEQVNLVRFHYDAERSPDLPWRQLHVRVFGDGTLEAHEEPSALMHKGPHIREESFDREFGTAAVERILEDAGIEVERLS